MLRSQSTSSGRLFSGSFGFFLAIFIPAMAVRCGFLIYLDTPFLFDKYPYFAERLASGHSIGNRLADLSPAYLHVATAFRWLTDWDWSIFKFFQAVIGSFNCWFTAVLGQRVFHSRSLGFAAGAILAVYGNLIVLETTLEPTVLVIFFNLLAILFLYRYVDAKATESNFRTYHHLLLSALFTGIAIITKPSFLLFIPIACLWLIIQPGANRSLLKTAAALTLFCAVALSIVFTVTLRNYIWLDDTILVTADAGKVFFHGNSKKATVTEWAGLPGQGLIEESSKEPDYAHVAFRQAASKQVGRKLAPSESSKFWTRIALADIAADPGRYLRRQLDKFLFFFSGYELHYIASAYKEYKASLTFPFIRIAWIIAPAVIGMILAVGNAGRLFPIYGLVLLYLVSGLIYVVQSRYRIPAAPFFCLFAAFAVQRLFQFLKAARVAAFGTILGSIAVVYMLSNTLLSERILALDKWYQATKIHYELDARQHFHGQRYGAAIEAASRALALEPDFAPAYNLKGKSFALLGNHQAAIENFQKVIRLTPDHPEGYRNMGFACLLMGEQEAAISYLEKVLEMAPEDKKALAALTTLKGAPGTPP